MAHGLHFKLVPQFKCYDCEIAKLTQPLYHLAQHLPSTEKLSLVHTNICGPVPLNMEGHGYFATLTNDDTPFKWILSFKTKGVPLPKPSSVQPMPKKQRGAKMTARNAYALRGPLLGAKLGHLYAKERDMPWIPLEFVEES